MGSTAWRPPASCHQLGPRSSWRCDEGDYLNDGNLILSLNFPLIDSLVKLSSAFLLRDRYTLTWVVEAHRRALRPEAVDIVIDMNNVFHLLREGWNQEALELEEGVLEIWRWRLEPERLDTPDAMFDRSESYHIVGRKRETFELTGRP